MRPNCTKKGNEMKVYCLFEQSGTFKNEFIKLGYEAYDYDIKNDFGQTDYKADLFSEIRGGYNGKPSVFDNIAKEDLILAFFPCTHFQENNAILLRGEANQLKNKTLEEKLVYSMKRHKDLSQMYELISMLFLIAIRRGLQMIVENPYTQPHYLTTYWCVKPTLIDKDRTINGDYYKKPTQFWFVNREPKNNFLFEPIEYVETRIISKQKKQGYIDRQVLRSMIHPQYANRFIRERIIDAN